VTASSATLPAVVTCIGIDLAWSTNNTTGAAVVAGDAHAGMLVDSALLGSDAEIAAYVARHSRTNAVLVAIDAPLRVPNQNGRREAEAALGRVFGRYEASAHSANRRQLTSYNQGEVRGEALAALLEQQGLRQAPAIVAGTVARQFTEVYPHAAMVALFGLPRTLKYKARHKRSRAERLHAWQHYQQHMRDLQHAEPALHGHLPLLEQDIVSLRGQALKHYEDRIDALLCAYIALYAFHWGMARCCTFGSLEAGYIFTPVPVAHSCDDRQ
jgi:predicted RNase H-like nuclease